MGVGLLMTLKAYKGHIVSVLLFMALLEPLPLGFKETEAIAPLPSQAPIRLPQAKAKKQRRGRKKRSKKPK